MIRFLLLALLAASSTASAIVIRHDVDDSKYRIPASEFPALVDMPGEGHGVLIAPQWVITANANQLKNVEKLLAWDERNRSKIGPQLQAMEPRLTNAISQIVAGCSAKSQ